MSKKSNNRHLAKQRATAVAMDSTGKMLGRRLAFVWLRQYLPAMVAVGLAIVCLGISWKTRAYFGGSGSKPVTSDTGEAGDRVAAGNRRLILWVVDTSPQGLAIALNDLEQATQRCHELRQIDAGKPPVFGVENRDKEIGTQELIKALLSPATRAARPSFLMRRLKAGKTDAFDVQIAVKFAPENSLFHAWMPLFERCGREDETTRDWDGFLKQHELSWLRGLGADLCGEVPVVILGPDRSEDAPALWFALREVQRQSASSGARQSPRLPLIVSTGATSSLLNLPPFDPARKAHPARWRDALARMAGYSDTEISRATKPQIEQVDRALKQARDAANRFILYTKDSSVLAHEMVEQTVGVMGCRRIAVFYPDRPVDPPTPKPLERLVATARPGMPTHRLFGPSMAEDFHAKFQEKVGDLEASSGAKFIPIPIPVLPAPRGKTTDPEIWGDPDFRKELARALRPSLRYLKHAGIDAIGVFGEIDIKLALFGVIRDELPGIPLFTHDADYRLESPHATPSGEPASPGRPRTAVGETDGLDGLLVVSAPDPPRQWVEDQFVRLDSMVPPGVPVAFLPDIHAYYTYHVVWKLIEQLQTGRGPSWEALDREPIQHRTGTPPDHCIECGLQEPFSQVMKEPYRGWDREVSEKFKGAGARWLLLSGGQLGALDGEGLARAILAAAMMTALVAGVLLILFRGDLRGAKPSGGMALSAAALLAPTLMMSCALGFDSSALPVSVAAMPDGHSLLPSIFLQCAAAALMLWLPSRYARALKEASNAESRSWSFDRWSPPPVSGARDDVRRGFRDWIDKSLLPHIRNGRAEWIACAAIGLLMACLDVMAGLPARRGWAFGTIFVTEWFVITLVTATAWSYLEVARELARFRHTFENWPRDWKSAVDPETIRRMGTAFVDSVWMALAVLLLLLASRLPSLGMPRWRWDLASVSGLPPKLRGLPVGVLFFGVGVTVIVAYWSFGYFTLRELIAQAKAARLVELDTERDQYIAANAAALTLPLAKPLREELEKYESRRRDVDAIPDKPWAGSDAFKARAALATAVLPWLIPRVLGAVGGTLADPISQAIKGLFK